MQTNISNSSTEEMKLVGNILEKHLSSLSFGFSHLFMFILSSQIFANFFIKAALVHGYALRDWAKVISVKILSKQISYFESVCIFTAPFFFCSLSGKLCCFIPASLLNSWQLWHVLFRSAEGIHFNMTCSFLQLYMPVHFCTVSVLGFHKFERYILSVSF